MALSQIELDYLRNNDHLFNTGDLATILNGLMKSVVNSEIGQRSAKRLGLFSALAIDQNSIKLVVENRGQSRSKHRADAGQQILRVYYGVEVPGLDGHLANDASLANIPTWNSLDGKGHLIFSFTYFIKQLSKYTLLFIIWNCCFNRYFWRNNRHIILQKLNQFLFFSF